MIHSLELKIPAKIALSESLLLSFVAKHLAVDEKSITGIKKIKQSIDARKKDILVQLKADVFVNEPFKGYDLPDFQFKDVKNKESIIIVGTGPAGLFAALRLLELGLKPVLVERGKTIRDRRRDLALLMKERTVDPDSNYCFGEGGAGTYSDGKLYTRSGKRGNIDRILHLFVKHGAEENILFEAHPHIGTNKLPKIIENIRETILQYGGEIHFNTRVTELIIEKGVCKGVVTQHKDKLRGKAVILATGHSARDIFLMLHQQKIAIETKPFALGVRVEHPQELIDKIQYHCDRKEDYLPPSAYSLVHNAGTKSAFSFCMCPGGIIAPAMTNPNEIVVNGWSPSKRNNPFANSGIVVNVDEKDFAEFHKYGSLQAMYFQESIEQKAFTEAGSNLSAPAQRLVDFVNNKSSANLPLCSYQPGIVSTDLRAILPSQVIQVLKEGLKAFGKKMHGYYTNEAVLVGVESRTSSPVRIPRNREDLNHPQLPGLIPSGEGAGFAGGIVSAAMDGERCAEAALNVIIEK
jgi:uncharacterized protein